MDLAGHPVGVVVVVGELVTKRRTGRCVPGDDLEPPLPGIRGDRLPGAFGHQAAVLRVRGARPAQRVQRPLPVGVSALVRDQRLVAHRSARATDSPSGFFTATLGGMYTLGKYRGDVLPGT